MMPTLSLSPDVSRRFNVMLVDSELTPLPLLAYEDDYGDDYDDDDLDDFDDFDDEDFDDEDDFDYDDDYDEDDEDDDY